MPQPNYIRREYHAIMPPWRNARELRGRYVGIELEVGHSEGYRKLLDILPLPRGGGERPITERDGSLNQETSCEIVFPPYKYRDAKRATSFLQRAFAALKAGGVEPDEEGGMHLNINTNGWGKEKIGAFMCWINALSPDWMQNIGGREAGEYCERLCLADPNCYYEWETDHNMVDRKARRLECRFPKATVEVKQLNNLLLFLECVEKAAGNKKLRGKLAACLRDGEKIEVWVENPWGDGKLIAMPRFNPNKHDIDDYLVDYFGDVTHRRVTDLFSEFLDSIPQTPELLEMKEVLLHGYR